MIQMPGNVRNLKQSDSALMLSFAAGDLGGFKLLYRRHSQAVYRFFYFGTNGDETLTSELFLDVWITVVRGRVRYTNEITFTDWLYHSAWARLHDHLRLHPLDNKFDHTLSPTHGLKVKGLKNKDSKESTVVSLEPRASLEQTDCSIGSAESELKKETDTPGSQHTDGGCKSVSDEDSVLLSCVSNLIPEHKEVVLLRFCFSMNNQEIADFLDIGKSVIERTCREAVVLLRAQLNSNKAAN